ncbi:MAG TPA: carbohydrate ABC transporter permease [Ignavibacteriaceae bacterium]|nr:carbohydrate ABC transporter permease [Ignavibacteriaceae bacterium]
MKTFKKILLYSLVIFISLITLIPFLWMVSASFMSMGEASSFPPRFIPEHFTLEHYITLFTNLNLTRYFINSVIISTGVTLVSLLVNTMGGYAFAKFRFKRKKTLFNFLLSSMIIPAQVTMLPVFLILKNLGLINTYFAIIIPGMASIFGIFLIRQFVMGIPDSLIEAAKMDGAGDFEIYYKVIIPLCRPILITLGIFTFMGAWNDFLWPLIVMTDSNMYTMPVALASLSGEHRDDTELMMAGSFLTVLPVIIVFLALQKYYIKGIMMGGVKE